MPAHRRFPAEWEAQDAVLLTWPHAGAPWGESLAAAERAIEAMALAIADRQPVLLTVADAPDAVRARLLAGGAAPERLHTTGVASDDIWIRDYGPLTTMEHSGSVCVDFRFNGWGGKFPAQRDDAVTAQLHARGGLGNRRLESHDTILEGGAVDTDGAGTLLTTSRCLLHPGRNPGADRAFYERLFARTLGCDRTLWLDDGWLEGDDTDGHVDMLARFVDTETIAHAASDDPADPHFQPLQALAESLGRLRTREGHPYRLVPLAIPEPVTARDGRRLPATYVNFLVVNGSVLVPRYGAPQDREAETRIGALFPGRRVVGIDARALIEQGGALHCAAMQIPAQARTGRSRVQ